MLIALRDEDTVRTWEVELNPESSKVQVWTGLTHSDSKELSHLGTEKCSEGWNVRSPNTNVAGCRNERKNKAYAAGADFIVFTSSVQS